METMNWMLDEQRINGIDCQIEAEISFDWELDARDIPQVYVCAVCVVNVVLFDNETGEEMTPSHFLMSQDEVKKLASTIATDEVMNNERKYVDIFLGV